MGILRRLLDFYLRGSLHVALSAASLVLMTQHVFGLAYDVQMVLFVFFGTITGYNFVKYDEIARVRSAIASREIRIIAALSFLSFVGAAVCFFQFRWITQLLSMAVLALTALYTLPFFPNRRNARNWAGVKIYIVSVCWVGVTLVLPLVDADVAFSADFLLKCLQRFLLIFSLVLVFEIVDMEKDDPHLQTVPQTIGRSKTKMLGSVLMLAFLLLELLRSDFDVIQFFINGILTVVVIAFLQFATPQRHRYYSLLWAESIPMLWFLMVWAAGHWPEC